MQCPKCRYEPTMAEAQRSPADCVQCGANYEGHARHVANVTAQREAEKKRNAEAPAAHVKAAMISNKGAQPVVVTDINMSFNSMVVFMVKVVFAAIPAAILVAIIWAFIFVILGFIGAAVR